MGRMIICKKDLKSDTRNTRLLVVFLLVSTFICHTYGDSDDGYTYSVDHGLEELPGISPYLHSTPQRMPEPKPRSQPQPHTPVSSCDKMGLPGYPEFYLETIGNWNMKKCPGGMEYVAMLCSCFPKIKESRQKSTPTFLNKLQRLLVGLADSATKKPTPFIRPAPQQPKKTTHRPLSLQLLRVLKIHGHKKTNVAPSPKVTILKSIEPNKPDPPYIPSGGDSYEVTSEEITDAQPKIKTSVITTRQSVTTTPKTIPPQPPREQSPPSSIKTLPRPRIFFVMVTPSTTDTPTPIASTSYKSPTRTTTKTTTTTSPTTTISTRATTTSAKTTSTTTTQRPTTTTILIPTTNIATTKASSTTPTPTTTTAVTTLTRETTTENYVQKICEGCIFERGIGYVDDASDCNKYIMCYSTGLRDDIRADVRTCGLGKYWDQALLTCRPSRDVPCRSDRCKHLLDSYTYAYDENCRAYWECQGGVSVGKCCPRGQGFIPGFGCTQATRCNATCWDDTIEDVCNKYPVPGRASMFRQNIAGHGFIDMHCASGTVFNKTSCNCQYGTFDKHAMQVCNKEVDVHFTNSGLSDVSGNALHIGNENVTITSGMACFHGNGAILIPRFSNAYIGNALEIRIKFKIDSSKTNGRYQSLLYNGDCNMDPSVVVSANRDTIMFTLRSGDNVTKSISTSVNDENNPWVDSTFALQNNKMSISLSGLVRASTTFTGHIARSRCGLKFGWGENFESFYGCVDQISIAFCNGHDGDR